MGQRRDDPGGLAIVGGVPELLAVPGAAILDVLKRHVPARVAPREDMDEPGLVAPVGVVVDGEQIAEIVEGQLLRIPQARGHDLEVAAVGMAAEDGTAAGIVVRPAIEGDLVTTIADREVDPSIGPQHEAMEIVAPQRDPDAIAGGELLPLPESPVDPAVTVEIAEPVQRRNAGQPHVAAPGEDPGGRPRHQAIEAVGIDARLVGNAVAVGVDEPPHPVVIELPLGHRLRVEEAAVEIIAIFNRLRGEIGIDPRVVVAAVVVHRAPLPERLADKHAPLFVDRESDRIGDIGLGGKQPGLKPLPHPERGRRRHRLVRFLGDGRLLRRWDRVPTRNGLRRGSGQKGEKDGKGDDEGTNRHGDDSSRMTSLELSSQSRSVPVEVCSGEVADPQTAELDRRSLRLKAQKALRRLAIGAT